MATLDNSSKDVVTREIDGFTFSFAKKEDGKIEEYSQVIKVGEITQDGVTFELTAQCYYPEREEAIPVYRARFVKYDSNLKHLILPYSVRYNGHEYGYHGNKFPIDSHIEKITIESAFRNFADRFDILSAFPNLKTILIEPRDDRPFSYARILYSSKACYTEKQLSHSNMVFVPDGYMVCPSPTIKKEEKKRYNTRTETEESNGFWNALGQHIKVLSIPNNFFVLPKDFCSFTCSRIFQEKYGQPDVDEYNIVVNKPSPIKIIIMRESIDNPELYNIDLLKWNLKADGIYWYYNKASFDPQKFNAQIFGDTELYVHKKHLRTLDDKLGSSVFKAIKPFEELPEEYRFLLGEKKAHEEKEEKIATGVSIDLEKLIETALVDGVVTDKERAILCKKVKEAGGNVDEFEMLLDARIYEAQQKANPSTPKAEPKKEEPKPEPKKDEPKPAPAKPASASSADGKMTVAQLAAEFKAQFGSVLRIYNGRSKADDNLSLQEVGLTGNLSLPFDGNQKVGDFIAQMAQVGLKVKVYTCDEWVACLDGLTLTQTGQVKKCAVKADMEKML